MDLMRCFEEHTGFGVLSTADKDGRVNAAVYARPHCFEPRRMDRPRPGGCNPRER